MQIQDEQVEQNAVNISPEFPENPASLPAMNPAHYVRG
jgi:hypothetical protein